MKIDIDCIILAAGMSSRMSTWKMLLPFAGKSLIETTIDNALAVCERVIVVVGYRSFELIELLGQWENIIIIENKEFKKGMFTSVQTGVSIVKSEYFFITHGDLPLIPPSIYQKLSKFKGNKAVFPVFNDKRGHPVLLPQTIIETILAEKVDSSMKKLLSIYPTRLVPVNTDGIYMDVDTDENYKNLLINQ
ncbi:MAG: NTP transferase domain-containing protein [Spirochaetaceae bacterium]